MSEAGLGIIAGLILDQFNLTGRRSRSAPYEDQMASGPDTP